MSGRNWWCRCNERRALLSHLRRHGCEPLRQGSKHSIHWHPANRKTSSIPRHSEISDKLAIKICRDLGIPTP
ncbi:MAG: type II toxin-antitoxin system HicA family toxin [Desulfobaccales bacterium]